MSLRTILVCALFATMPAFAGTYEHFWLPRVVPAEPGLIAVTPTHLWVIPKNTSYEMVKVGFDGVTQDLQYVGYANTELTATPDDGNAWFASGSSFSTITPAGADRRRLPYPDLGGVHGIVLGPDDHIWVAASLNLLRVDRSTLDYQYRSAQYPSGIAAGPDGNVWIAFGVDNAIGKMTSDGTLTTYAHPADGNGTPNKITAASDGKLWFTTSTGRTRGVSTSGSFTAAFDGGATGNLVAGTDGRLWWFNSTLMRKWVPGASSLESEYDIGASNVAINSIAASSDGVWWTSKGQNIGRVSYAGQLEQWQFRPYGPDPFELVSAFGDLWFTSETSNHIGRTTVAGVTTLYDLPNANSQPRAITVGPDGAVWFTEAERIGRIDAQGSIVEFALPAGVTGPADITTGPDGNLWIAARTHGILRMTPGGVFTSFTVPGLYSSPKAIVSGPDGNLWFTEPESAEIGRITPAGVVTQFASGTSFPTAIVSAGGNLWYSGSRTYRMSTTGVRTEIVGAPQFDDMAVGADGAIWSGRARLALDGTSEEHYPDFRPRGITIGPDGAMWTADGVRQSLVRINLDAPITSTPMTLCLPANRTVSGVIASFVDPDPRPVDKYFVQISWGDGQGAYGTLVETAPGHFDVYGQVTYALAGTKTATVTLIARSSEGRLGGTYRTTATFQPSTLVAGSVNFTSAGGNGSVPVNGLGGCGWTATKSASWITFPNGDSGVGSATLQYAVAPNTALETRYATITVGGQTLLVTQASPGGTGLYLVTPCRLYDSRETQSQIAPGVVWQLSTVASCGIAADAKALVANLTVVAPAQDGWLSVWKNGEAWPGVSTLNYRPGRTRANNAVIPLVDQAFLMRNGGTAPVHFVIDVTGYFK